MAKTFSSVFALTTLVCIAVCQSDVHNYPSAVAAPGEARPEICSPEPLQTPLPKWAPGKLSVDMVVGSNGKVVKLTVVNSSYDTKETESAMAVLRQWTFTPAYLRGKYVNVHFTVELTNSKDSVSVHIPYFAEMRGCKFSGFPTY